MRIYVNISLSTYYIYVYMNLFFFLGGGNIIYIYMFSSNNSAYINVNRDVCIVTDDMYHIYIRNFIKQ